MKKVFITGGAGFLAQHLVRILINEGYEVTCLVKESKNTKNIEELSLKIVRGNLKDKKILAELISEESIVYHCYSLSPGAHASREVYHQENVLSTQNLLDVCKEKKVSQFVYISSASIVGPHQTTNMNEETPANPDNEYGESKLEAENLVKAFHAGTKTPTLILRLSTLFGVGTHPNSANLKIFRWMKKPVFIIMGNGKNNFEFSYIKNVAHGVYDAATKVKNGCHTFIISDPQKISFNEIVQTIKKYVNPKAKIVHIPITVAKGVGKVGDVLTKVTGKRMPVQSRTVKGALGGWVANPQKAVDSFGLTQKYSLDEAVSETVTWLKENKLL